MLDTIRQNAQSWAIKILFGLIILVFVFWGVGNLGNDQATVIAKIQGQPITARNFRKAYQQTAERLRHKRPDLTRKDFEEMQLKRQVLNRLITSQLLLNEAKRLGLAVTSQQIRAQVQSMPVFQGANHDFEPSRYQEVLRLNQLTPAQFEADLAHNLMTNGIRQAVKAPAVVTEEQAKDLFEYSREKLRMEYAFFPWQEQTDIQPSKKAVESYYQENKDRFQRPARMEMEYLLFTPEALASSQEVSKEEIRSYYQSNPQEFRRQGQIKARNILVKVPKGASKKQLTQAEKQAQALARQLRQGADFADLAQRHSQAPNSAQGGSLGWLSRGELDQQALEQAAFALKVDEISSPVRTSRGFQLITVEDRKPAGTIPFSEAKQEIRDKIGADKAAQEMSNLLDDALDLLLSGKGLEETADSLGITLRQAGPFTKAKGPKTIDLSPEQMSTLFTLTPGDATQTPILLDNGYLIAKQTEFLPASPRPLEQVRDQISFRLKQKKGLELAQKEAQATLKANKVKGPDTRLSEPIGRQGPIPGLGNNPRLVEDLFATKGDTWLDKAYQVQGGYILARVAERIPPEKGQWEGQKEIWIGQLERSRSQALFQAYLNQLRQESEVEIVSPELLEY